MTSGVMSRVGLGKDPMSALRGTFVQGLLDDLQYLSSHDREMTIAAHCLCGLD
jgi:hypothetical protein